MEPDRSLGAEGAGESAVQSPGQLAARCLGGRGLSAPSRFSDLGSPRFPLGNYRTQLYDKQREEYQPATPGLGMFVEVKDPEDKVSRPLSPAEPFAVHFSARLSRLWYLRS